MLALSHAVSLSIAGRPGLPPDQGMMVALVMVRLFSRWAAYALIVIGLIAFVTRRED
ncbi:MAG: hypothetical protein AB7Q17_10560 [Phycisphaerae bacterium]